jgi:hypothetical protein
MLLPDDSCTLNTVFPVERPQTTAADVYPFNCAADKRFKENGQGIKPKPSESSKLIRMSKPCPLTSVAVAFFCKKGMTLETEGVPGLDTFKKPI